MQIMMAVFGYLNPMNFYSWEEAVAIQKMYAGNAQPLLDYLSKKPVMFPSCESCTRHFFSKTERIHLRRKNNDNSVVIDKGLEIDIEPQYYGLTDSQGINIFMAVIDNLEEFQIKPQLERRINPS